VTKGDQCLAFDGLFFSCKGARFEAVTAVLMKSPVFWVMMLCILVYRYQPFGGFKDCHPVVLLIVQKIKSISVQTQLNSIYYTELHVSIYLRPSSNSKLVFKTYRGRNIHYVGPQNAIKVIRIVKIVMVIHRTNMRGQRFCHNCYKYCLQILLLLLFQSCHNNISSLSISMWIHSKFNYVSGLPQMLIHSSDWEGVTKL
jgi:hypothetical protein